MDQKMKAGVYNKILRALGQNPNISDLTKDNEEKYLFKCLICGGIEFSFALRETQDFLILRSVTPSINLPDDVTVTEFAAEITEETDIKFSSYEDKDEKGITKPRIIFQLLTPLIEVQGVEAQKIVFNETLGFVQMMYKNKDRLGCMHALSDMETLDFTQEAEDDPFGFNSFSDDEIDADEITPDAVKDEMLESASPVCEDSDSEFMSASIPVPVPDMETENKENVFGMDDGDDIFGNSMPVVSASKPVSAINIQKEDISPVRKSAGDDELARMLKEMEDKKAKRKADRDARKKMRASRNGGEDILPDENADISSVNTEGLGGSDIFSEEMDNSGIFENDIDGVMKKHDNDLAAGNGIPHEVCSIFELNDDEDEMQKPDAGNTDSGIQKSEPLDIFEDFINKLPPIPQSKTDSEKDGNGRSNGKKTASAGIKKPASGRKPPRQGLPIRPEIVPRPAKPGIGIEPLKPGRPGKGICAEKKDDMKKEDTVLDSRTDRGGVSVNYERAPEVVEQMKHLYAEIDQIFDQRTKHADAREDGLNNYSARLDKREEELSIREKRLEDNYAERQQELDKKIVDVETQKNEIGFQWRKLDSERQLIETAKKDLDEQKSIFEKMKKLDAEASESEDHVSVLNAEIQEKNKELEVLRGTFASEKKEYEESVSALRQQIAELQETGINDKEYEAKISRLEKEIDNLNDEIADLNEDVKDLTEETAEKDQIIGIYQNKQAGWDAKEGEWKQREATYKKQVADVAKSAQDSSNSEELQNALDIANMRIKELEAEAAKKGSVAGDNEAEIVRLNQELAQAKEDLEKADKAYEDEKKAKEAAISEKSVSADINKRAAAIKDSLAEIGIDVEPVATSGELVLAGYSGNKIQVVVNVNAEVIYVEKGVQRGIKHRTTFEKWNREDIKTSYLFEDKKIICKCTYDDVAKTAMDVVGRFSNLN